MLSQVTNSLAQYAPWLFAIFIKSFALLLAIIAIAQLVRRRSASLRHFLYSVAMASLLILPLAATLLPNLRLAVLPSHPKSAEPSLPWVAQSQPEAPRDPIARAPNRYHGNNSRRLEQTDQVPSSTVSHNESAPPSKWQPITPSSPQKAILNWQGALVLLWICGVAVYLVRLAVMSLRLSRLISRAVAVDSIVLASRLRWLCRDLGIRREVVLLLSPELDVPITTGVFDPKIVLSPQCGEWSETRRNAVLCHEIAHIKRLDAMTQWLASITAAIYWLNPLVWFVVRAMRNERERACDDYVLASGTAASDYAHELIEIVSTLVRPQPAAALAMARRSQLEGRVLALVNPGVGHGTLTHRIAVVLSSAILGIALPLAAVQLQERPPKNDASAPTSKAKTLAPEADETLQSSEDPRAPAPPAEFPNTPPPPNPESAIGIPVYPNAVAGEHEDGRGTVSLVDGAQVRRLAAGAYFSSDEPTKVMAFYRDRLKSLGPVIECAGGKNNRVDVQVNDASFADPSKCRSGEFAQGGTEFKVNGSEDQRVVVVVPHNRGSEIALVRYSPAGHDSAEPQISLSKSSTSDCFDVTHAAESSVHSHTDDDGYSTWTAAWSGGECGIEASSSGTVHFNAEATAIESISTGGHFEVNERRGDTLRHLRVEPGSNGQLTYTYKVNGTQQDFDAAARTWFSNFLVHLERVTDFAASTRVPALLAKGGPQAVLDEITQLQSDYVRQVYFIKLFENATLPGPMLVRALDQARTEISTDYSLAQVLLTIAQRYDLNDESQRVAFLNGANKLHIDYEHSRVLLELLKRPNLSPQLVRAALESAKSIGTDYEKGRILTTLAGLKTFDESEATTYLDLASSIHTDYDHSRSLMALIEHQKLSPTAVSEILKSASSIATDYEKSRVLLAVNGSGNFDEKQISAYLTLVDSVGTDYERSRDLIALMHEHKLSDQSLAKIIAETQKIGTDYEKARVLTEVAQHYNVQGATRDAYIKAANSIGTEYDRNRTLAAITKRELM
jgi:beta-lactamase regulating signal transducer with metallopeptidase domain